MITKKIVFVLFVFLFVVGGFVLINSYQNQKRSRVNPTVPPLIKNIITLDNYCKDDVLREKYIQVNDCGNYKILVQHCCDFPDVIIDSEGNKIAECGGIAGWSKECKERFPRKNCGVWSCDDKFPDKYRACIIDQDCGLDICLCQSMNNRFIKPEQKACTRFCEGTTRCINNVCQLVK